MDDPNRFAPNETTMSSYQSPVAYRLAVLADLAEQKHKEYAGSTYEKFGTLMAVLFPNGISCTTAQDWEKLGVVNMICHKLMRYTQTWEAGGHLDSANDLAVYGAMLAVITQYQRLVT